MRHGARAPVFRSSDPMYASIPEDAALGDFAGRLGRFVGLPVISAFPKLFGVQAL